MISLFLVKFLTIIVIMDRDTQIFDLIEAEKNRQINGLELIASENFVSDLMMKYKC